MKIKKIEIENFKSLKSINVANLLNVNMLYGYNNSGKSNLFKFLELVFSTNEHSIEIATDSSERKETQKIKEEFWKKNILNEQFIFRKENNQIFDISFSITIELDKIFLEKNLEQYEKFEKEYFGKKSTTVDLIYTGTIERMSTYQAQQKTTKVTLCGAEIFSLDQNNTPETFKGSRTMNYKNFESLMSLFNDCVLLLDNDRYFINEIENLNEEDISAKNFKSKIFSISLSYLKQEEFKLLNDFLKSFFINSQDKIFADNEKSSPFNNFQFEFIRIDKEIEVLLTNDFGKFPLSNFGTGVQQIIFILTKIFLAHKKIILIEEIELNLSPKYQLELIDFIVKKVIKSEIIEQLFYTTHSPLMCYRSEFRTLQARIDAKGISTIEIFTPNAQDVQKFKDAVKLLEHYHPSNSPLTKITDSKSVRTQIVLAKKPTLRKNKSKS